MITNYRKAETLKKKKIKLKIEDEFKFYKLDHKIRTIQCTLALFDEKTLYTPRLAKEFRNIKGSNYEERSYNLTKELYDDPDRTEKLYDYCWKQTRLYINDKTTYTADIYEALRKEFIIE